MTLGWWGRTVEPGHEWIAVVLWIALPAVAGAVSGGARSPRVRFAAMQAMLPLALAWVVVVAGALAWGGRPIDVLPFAALPPALFVGARALSARLRGRAQRSAAVVPPPVPPAGPP